MVEDQQLAGSRPDQELPPPDATGYQVVVGDIPSEPPGFWPRAGLLAELDRSSTRVSVLHAVRGLHGLGATQVAAAYARLKVAAGWRLVAWVNGADPGNLHAGLAAVADAAGLTDVGSGGSVDPGAAVRRWLETDGDRCLLVFDDVSDPELLRPFVPAGGTARVLITTNRQSAADLGSIVPVDVLSASEASAFLAGRTGLHDEAEAAAVAAELGYLPLALALAVPVISGQRHGYARYLDELQATPTDLSLTADHGRPYPQSVARAVLLSMAAVRASDKTGMCARMMAILAVLPAAAVRRELLYVVGRAGALTSGGRRVEAAVVDQVLDWLSDRSLLTSSLDGQTVTMHRLIARVIRHGLARRRRLGAVCWVAASMAEAYAIAQAGSQDRPAVRRIQQLVTALLENTAELAGEADEELAGILLRLRFLSLYHLTELGDSAPQAVATGELLTADLERLLGPGHPDTLNARNSLAAAYLAANRVADAISVFEQTLAVFQRQLGSDHPDALTSQNNLASAYQDAGRIAEAVQLHELTLAERERVLGADHPSTLTSQGNLAAAYLAAGRIAEAILCSSRPWPAVDECWARTTPIPRSRGRTWPRPTRTRAGAPRRFRCSRRSRLAGDEYFRPAGGRPGRSRRSSRPRLTGRVTHLQPTSGGRPPIRRGRRSRPASAGRPSIRPGGCPRKGSRPAGSGCPTVRSPGPRRKPPYRTPSTTASRARRSPRGTRRAWLWRTTGTPLPCTATAIGCWATPRPRPGLCRTRSSWRPLRGPTAPGPVSSARGCSRWPAVNASAGSGPGQRSATRPTSKAGRPPAASGSRR